MSQIKTQEKLEIHVYGSKTFGMIYSKKYENNSTNVPIHQYHRRAKLEDIINLAVEKNLDVKENINFANCCKNYKTFYKTMFQIHKIIISMQLDSIINKRVD
jgi:hypothetical protein